MVTSDKAYAQSGLDEVDYYYHNDHDFAGLDPTCQSCEKDFCKCTQKCDRDVLFCLRSADEYWNNLMNQLFNEGTKCVQECDRIYTGSLIAFRSLCYVGCSEVWGFGVGDMFLGQNMQRIGCTILWQDCLSTCSQKKTVCEIAVKSFP